MSKSFARKSLIRKRPPRNSKQAKFLQRVCLRKRNYSDLASAQKQAQNLTSKFGGKRNSFWVGYKCPYCPYFHAGRPNRQH